MERLTGIGVSPGVAVGPALVAIQRTQVLRFPVGPDGVARELSALERARQRSRGQLEQIRRRIAAARGADLAAIFDAAQVARASRIVGLMLLPPAVDNPDAARPYFRALRDVRDRLLARGVDASRLKELSMGMSHDFEVAVEEGATLVRVGTAIFGSRPRGQTL